MMKLADFVVPEATIADLRAGTREEAAREMVEVLHAMGCVDGADREDVVQAILRREGLGTTGVGEGVAFPEARHRAIPRLLGALAISRGGVGFDAVDGNPVHILFLVAAPHNKPGDFLEAAVVVSRLLRDEHFRARLRRAETREEIVGLLAEADRDSL
jgi:PTS system fructose-specific IIA component/PTS system nitrogen regulatory IIA component